MKPHPFIKTGPPATERNEVIVVLTMRDLFIIDEALQALCAHQLAKHQRTRNPQAAAVAQTVNNTRAPILEARIRLNHKINTPEGEENAQAAPTPDRSGRQTPTRRKGQHRRKAADTVR